MLKPSVIRELFEQMARTKLAGCSLTRNKKAGTEEAGDYEDIRTQREWIRFKRAAKVILDALAEEKVQYVIAKMNPGTTHPKLFFSNNPFIHRHTIAVEKELQRLTKRHPTQSFMALKIGTVAHGADSKLKDTGLENFFACKEISSEDQLKAFDRAISENLVQLVGNTAELHEARQAYNKRKCDIVIKVTEPLGEYAENSYTLMKVVDPDRVFGDAAAFTDFVKLVRGVARYTLWPDRYPLKE